MKNYKIAVAGTGYVGLSLGVLFAQHHQVVAVDIVQAKVDMINNKKSPIQDDYIEKYLAEKDLDLTATLDAKAAWIRYTEIFRGGFPELTDRLAGLLDDTNFLTDLNDRLSALGEAYAEDP